MTKTMRTSVVLRIEDHREAVLADEATFTVQGVSIDEAASEASLKREIEAFRAFAAEPCRTAEDARAKVDYLLTGTVGERDKLIDCLVADERYGDGGLIEAFLKSLLPTPD